MPEGNLISPRHGSRGRVGLKAIRPTVASLPVSRFLLPEDHFRELQRGREHAHVLTSFQRDQWDYSIVTLKRPLARVKTFWTLSHALKADDIDTQVNGDQAGGVLVDIDGFVLLTALNRNRYVHDVLRAE